MADKYVNANGVSAIKSYVDNKVSNLSADNISYDDSYTQMQTNNVQDAIEYLEQGVDNLNHDISSKQDTLISGTNIKTINNQSLLGSGNIAINTTTIDYQSVDQNIDNYIYNEPRDVQNAFDNIGQYLYDERIQSQGNYIYRIYNDGTFEVWFKQTGYSITINSASGNLYRSALTSLALPSNMYNNYTCNILHAEVNCSHNNYPAWGMLASVYDTGVNFYAMSGGSRSASPNYTLTAYMFGTLS